MKAHRHAHLQAGVAAIELTLVLFSTIVLLAALLFCARLGWHAIALHRSTYSAALLMADAAPEQMTDPASTAQVLANTRAMLVELLHGAGVNTPVNPFAIAIDCDGGGCIGAAQPQNIHLYMSMPVAADGVGDGLVQYMLGSSSITINTDDVVPYAP